MESRHRAMFNKNNVDSKEPAWKWPSLGKENCNPAPKVPKTKNTLNTIQADLVMRDMKANATKTLSNIKTTFDNISQKLRRSSRKRSSSSLQSYENLDNAVTPVKLYSPFGIETPSPRREAPATRGRLAPRSFEFTSPTGKLKQDIEELSSGMRELSAVAKSLPNRKRKPKHVSQESSCLLDLE